MVELTNIRVGEAVEAPADPSPQPIAADGSITAKDASGRVFKIKKIGPLQRLRLFKAVGPELSQNDRYLGYAVLAASVVEIEGQPVSFPQSELQIEALISRLGDDGFAAVGGALSLSMAATNTADSAKN